MEPDLPPRVQANRLHERAEVRDHRPASRPSDHVRQVVCHRGSKIALLLERRSRIPEGGDEATRPRVEFGHPANGIAGHRGTSLHQERAQITINASDSQLRIE